MFRQPQTPPAELTKAATEHLHRLAETGGISLKSIKRFASEVFSHHRDIVDTTSVDAFLSWVHADIFLLWSNRDLQRVYSLKYSNRGSLSATGGRKPSPFNWSAQAGPSKLDRLQERLQKSLTLDTLSELSSTRGKRKPRTFLNTIISNDFLRDTVLSHCGPATFLLLSRTCKDAKTAVKAYMRRTFRIDKMFSRWFTSPLVFRRLQAKTGCLVSGSAALHFFDRTCYPDGNIDIYVAKEHRLQVAEHLLSEGYAFVPCKEQPAVFSNANSAPHLEVDSAPTDPCDAVLDVFVFEKKQDKGDTLKVQLTVARASPMAAILQLDSTNVMNVISCDAAYSLYPGATFQQRISLICKTSTNNDETGLPDTKDQKQGWLVDKCFSNNELRDFHLGKIRWIGDNRCWTIPLDTSSITERIPLSLASKSLKCDPIVASNWVLNLQDGGGQTEAQTISDSLLSCTYTSALRNTKVLDLFLNSRTKTVLQKDTDINIYLDADFITMCLQQYMYISDQI